MPTAVVVPALNEAAALPETLRSVLAQRPHELIVVDGGSADATRDVAAGTLGVTLLDAPRGRAAQMNAGAARATGDVILFLHADCTLDPGALAAAGRVVRRPGVAAGCFTMRVRAAGALYRALDGCATARVRLTGFVYGDQGLFLRRDVFDRVGGFPPVKLMEDVLISRSLRRLGRVVVLPQRIHVSPRRWQRAGLVRQTLRNWALTAAAAAGVHPDRLAEYYPAVR
jgi:rSAM/selenodomain-associated transferase 2